MLCTKHVWTIYLKNTWTHVSTAHPLRHVLLFRAAVTGADVTYATFHTNVCLITFNDNSCSDLHRNFIPDNLVEAFFRKVHTVYEERFVRGDGDASDTLPEGWRPIMIDSPSHTKLVRRIAIINATNMAGMY